MHSHFTLNYLNKKSVKDPLNELKPKQSPGYNNIWTILGCKDTHTTHILRTLYNSFIYPIFTMLCFYGNIKQIYRLFNLQKKGS